MRSLVLPPGSDLLAEACPGARELGDRTISGRAAVGYRCRWKDIGTFGEAREIWVDEATGLILGGGKMGVVRVNPDQPVDETTFSTSVPEGAEGVEVVER